ncbi:T9SS type A sorting domain-containing protein, partial [Ulvibacter litoralis]
NDIKTQAYTASETFTPTTSGGYYVAIHALGSNGTDGGGFFLFNLSVEESIVPPCSVAATVPYYEDFSNGDPECWLKEDTDNTLPVWMYNTGTDIDGDGIGDPIYQIIAPGTQDPLKNDWAFSQKVHMEAGTTYYVSSHYNVVDLGSSTSFEDFEMWVTDAQSSNASFKELLNTYQGITQQGQFPGQSNGNDLEAMAYLAEEGFTPTTTGDYYVGIHATGSTAIGGAFLLFDVGVNTEPTAQDCTEAAVTPYYEDFSNGSPACWEYEDADNQNPVWAYNNTTDISGDGTNDPILIMAPANVSTTQKDDYAFSKKIQLIAGVEYIIEVAYNSLNLGNAVASENFDLIITDEPNATATQTVLGSYNDILQQGDFPGNNDGNDLESQAYTASEVFTPTTSGEYYVGVHALGTTGTDAGGLLLFDLGVSVNTVPSGGELIIIPTTGYVTSVNYNGTAAAGYNTEHFIWNGNGNFEVIGGVPPGNGIGGQTGISDDGNTVSAGYLNTVSGLVEMSTYEISTQTWTSLGGIGGDDGVEASSTYAISGDATTVVGLGYTEAGGPGGAHAVAWTEATGVVDLGSTVPQAFSRANATNVDGTVIAGWQDTATGFRQGAVWINGVQHLIDFPNGDKAGEAQTVSNDGVWVGGIGNFANNHQAWRWNEDTEIESLGPSPIQGYRGATTGLSEDGSIAVGYYKPGSLPAIFGVGFIWTEATGVVELNEYAATLGIDTQGVTLALPLDISADGTAIVGSGLDSNNNRVGFLLRLEPTILGVDEPTIEDTFSYYPNPVNDVLHFSGTTPLKSITIYTVTGQIVAQKAITSTKGELNISELANGIYIARIEGYESSKTVKIIKK